MCSSHWDQIASHHLPPLTQLDLCDSMCPSWPEPLIELFWLNFRVIMRNESLAAKKQKPTLSLPPPSILPPSWPQSPGIDPPFSHHICCCHLSECYLLDWPWDIWCDSIKPTLSILSAMYNNVAWLHCVVCMTWIVRSEWAIRSF